MKRLEGVRFGRLVALRQADSRKSPSGKAAIYWLCRCDCGTEKEIAAGVLQTGHAKSCGCFRTERSKLNAKHGMEGTPEYRAWQSLKARCTNTKSRAYADYGGRGITVCKPWLASFENFYLSVGQRPSPKHSIDRIDNDGNYEPGNCRWATKSEQSKNQRKRRRTYPVGMMLERWEGRHG